MTVRLNIPPLLTDFVFIRESRIDPEVNTGSRDFAVNKWV